MAAATSAALPYSEPGINKILIISLLMLTLNIVNFILDRYIYCGLLGQIFVGVAWGTPAAKWLATSLESSFVGLGYVGLILLVYEGGLSTSFTTLKTSLPMSVCIAATGIAAPIGLSFVLQKLLNATPLQAFAAGAALCSTSLGTTFTVLSTSGLTKTRLGVILSTAAMIDDVFGLVIIQVISNLGTGSTVDAATVIRPIFVSLGFVIFTPLLCLLLVKPVTKQLNQRRERDPGGRVNKVLSSFHAAFILHTTILLGMVTAGSYAGTSNLFTAYLAGISISWWDSEVSHPVFYDRDEPSGQNSRAESLQRPHNQSTGRILAYSGLVTYERYYGQVVDKILKPFFFASIGFSIPISQLFSGRVIWRSLVYTILMCFGKLVCGLWLLRLELRLRLPRALKFSDFRVLVACYFSDRSKKGRESINPAMRSRSSQNEVNADWQGQNKKSKKMLNSYSVAGEGKVNQQCNSAPNAAPLTKNPLSLYPAAIVGCAMIARGEIGFLVSSIAQSRGIFSSETGPSEVFLVVTWAIVLCTIIGPLSVGAIVRRVRNLENKRHNAQPEGRRDILGDWGVK